MKYSLVCGGDCLLVTCGQKSIVICEGDQRDVCWWYAADACIQVVECRRDSITLRNTQCELSGLRFLEFVFNIRAPINRERGTNIPTSPDGKKRGAYQGDLRR